MKLKMATVALLVLGLGAARAAAGEILLLTLGLPFSHRRGCQTGKKLDSDPLYKQCQQNYAQVDSPRPDLHIMSIQCLWLKFQKLQFCLTRNLVHHTALDLENGFQNLNFDLLVLFTDCQLVLTC